MALNLSLALQTNSVGNSQHWVVVVLIGAEAMEAIEAIETFEAIEDIEDIAVVSRK